MNSNTMQYATLTATNSTLQAANMAFALVGLALTISVTLGLGVSLIDVGLGILVASGAGFLIGFILPIALSATGGLAWYLMHLMQVSQFLGPAITILGVGFFVGLPAALLIVIAPMMITVPTFAAFRAWAIRHYA